MITDADITKLKKVFLTKEDGKKHATKKDLEKFATKKDLEKYATKEALADLKLEVGEVHDKVDLILEKMDHVVGAIQDLRTENAAGAVILNRHTRQIEALVAHTGAVIPEF